MHKCKHLKLQLRKLAKVLFCFVLFFYTVKNASDDNICACLQCFAFYPVEAFNTRVKSILRSRLCNAQARVSQATDYCIISVIQYHDCSPADFIANSLLFFHTGTHYKSCGKRPVRYWKRLAWEITSNNFWHIFIVKHKSTFDKFEYLLANRDRVA